MNPLRRRLKLLKKYLDNKSGKQETIIEQWYHSVDDSTPVPIWKEEGKEKAVHDSIYSFLFNHIHAGALHTVKRMPVAGAMRWKIAAVITGLLIGAGVLFFLLRPAKELPYVTVEVPVGKIQQVRLPDNTVAWLKSGSILRYRSDFNTTDRQVELSNGEAFFEVHPDANRPFIVRSQQLQTRVLGTAFLVQAYKEQALSKIWVEHGLVEVSDSGKVLKVLSKHERLEWDKLTRLYKTDSLQWQQALAWQKGILLLKSASFTELSNSFAEFYGVKLVSDDPNILRQRFDGKFFISTPLDKILPMITELHHIRHRRTGNKIIFY